VKGWGKQKLCPLFGACYKGVCSPEVPQRKGQNGEVLGPFDRATKALATEIKKKGTRKQKKIRHHRGRGRENETCWGEKEKRVKWLEGQRNKKKKNGLGKTKEGAGHFLRKKMKH